MNESVKVYAKLQNLQFFPLKHENIYFKKQNHL